MLENVPKSLLEIQNRLDDVSVIIGENGSGKSTLLNELSKFYTRRGKNVLGIANSIHDKFENSNSKFKSLRARSGRTQSSTIIKKAIINTIDNDDTNFFNFTRILNYVGFDPLIGIEINNLHYNYKNLLPQIPNVSKSLKEEIMSLLIRLENEVDKKGILWIDLNNKNFSKINKLSLMQLFPNETFLKQIGLIGSFEILLAKKNKVIPLLNASSGELSLITSVMFLSSIIKEENTVLLIDEPENSLHPKWQRNYIKLLLDLFYYYTPKIIIATHSPMIMDLTSIDNTNFRIFKSNNFNFTEVQRNEKNIESVYYNLFEIITPENRFLSNLLVNYLNMLGNKEITLNSLNERLQEIKRSIQDKKQLVIIDRVHEIAQEISNE